jgi:hypothetical protein
LAARLIDSVFRNAQTLVAQQMSRGQKLEVSLPGVDTCGALRANTQLAPFAKTPNAGQDYVYL